MKRVSVTSVALLVAALSASACSKDKAPVNPSNPNQVKFTAALNQANEVPSPANADGTGTGTAAITLNLTKDAAGNITAATADFTVTLTGFPANTPVTGAHIHPGRPGTSGGVLISLALASGEVTLSASGAGSFTKSAVSVTAVDAQNLINDPIGFYFNVHTVLSPGGAIRGQLVKL